MKLQTGTRLALYAVLELARDPECTLSAADLAERFGVSSHHLAKVLRTLAASGLVRGGRGAAGGYRFTGNRRRTTLMDIVALFEPAPGQRKKEPGEDTPMTCSAAQLDPAYRACSARQPHRFAPGSAFGLVRPSRGAVRAAIWAAEESVDVREPER